MTTIGTPNSESATKVLFCGAGELGKEVVIELQRYGVEVVAVDRYSGAPAMQVAHRFHVVNMTDGNALEKIIREEKPDFIIPEIEAIATDKLVELESEGFKVIPTARATSLTMDREGIRRLAAEELKLPTSPYRFAGSKEEYLAAVKEIKLPAVVKPVMSSSGKGQSTVKLEQDIEKAWDYAQQGSRGKSATEGAERIIVEGFVEFDYEITLLTVRHAGGTSFCQPIGHRQEKGDYRESWQPQEMTAQALKRAQDIAKKVTDNLGGRGVFGVELFIKGDEVYFSEVSPRPHDTGLVTIASQNLSEFALHARAILGLPIPEIKLLSPAASSVILVEGNSNTVSFSNIDQALEAAGTELRLFGKPEVQGERRMGVALATGPTPDAAKEKAIKCSETIVTRL